MLHLPAKRFLQILVTLLFFLGSTGLAYAFPSASTNYKIDSELGVFGGEKNSTNYRLTDTGGGFAVGFSNSTNYLSCSGFQCTLSQVPTITVSLSATSINLGTLTTGAVNTDSHTVSVTTNIGGYTTRVYSDGTLRRSGGADIDAVGDGAVSAGAEEYGIATSQSGQDITQDTSCGSAAYNASGLTTSQQSVASKAGPTYTAESTTICYAASRSGLTAAGNYQQIVYFVTTGSF